MFLTVSGVESICGPADENHNSFCAVAAGPTVPVSIPLTTFTDSTGVAFITTSSDVLSGKTAHGTVNSNSGEFEFLSMNDTYTVHGTASGAFPITVTLHVTGSFGKIPNSVWGNLLGFGVSQLEIGTFHPEATLTQFVIDPFPADALNPMSPQGSQSHSAATGPPQTFPLDVQVSYVKMVSVNDVFDIAYGIDLNTAGSGRIDMNTSNIDIISFALPTGVFLTSALGATFGTPSLVGDYNGNGVVDAADYTIWHKSLGSTTNLAADGDGNHVVDAADYNLWKSNFGNHFGSGTGANASVPEPATLSLLMIVATGCRISQKSVRVDSFKTHQRLTSVTNRPLFLTQPERVRNSSLRSV